MADWKTYAKAARNTARKQAPGARDAAQRATSRAGDYARAAGRAVEEGRHDDDAPGRGERGHDGERAGAPAPQRSANRPSTNRSPEARPADDRPAQDRPAPRAESSSRTFRDEAKIYATVAGRTAQRAGEQAKQAGIGARIARAVRDALLIGVSLLAIWGVLYAAGLPIPFSAVLIAVLVIMAIALGTGLYAQFVRDKAARETDQPDD